MGSSLTTTQAPKKQQQLFVRPKTARLQNSILKGNQNQTNTYNNNNNNTQQSQYQQPQPQPLPQPQQTQNQTQYKINSNSQINNQLNQQPDTRQQQTGQTKIQFDDQQPTRPQIRPQPLSNENLQAQRLTAMQQKPSNFGEIQNDTPRKPTYDIQKWKILINNLQENLKLINYIHSRPRKTFKSVNELGVFIRNAPTQSEIEIAWIIYVWISQNIDYDVDSFRTGFYNDIDLEPEGVLESGKTISWGYAKLYEELCKSNDIECISISGYAKGLSYRQNHAFIDPNHEWNAVKLNGVWQLLDVTWGTGYVSDEFIFYRKFIPHYFLTPPQIFIYDHYSEQYQLQPQKMSLRRFEKLPLLKLEFFLNEVRCLSHDIFTSIRPIERNFKMEFSCAEDTVLLASLEKTTGDIIDRAVAIQYDKIKNIFELFINLPNGKDSVLNMFTRKNGEESQFCGEVFIHAPLNIETSFISVSENFDSSDSEVEEILIPITNNKRKQKIVEYIEPMENKVEILPRKQPVEVIRASSNGWDLDLKEKGLYELVVPPEYNVQVKEKYDYYIQDKNGRTSKLVFLDENKYKN